MRRTCGIQKSVVALLVAWSALGGSAQAALFGDDEARRAILDLRQRLEQSQIANRTLSSNRANSKTNKSTRL
jgi:hypothetical protein